MPADRVPVDDEAEEAACRQNLHRIAQAVQAYRAENDGEFPFGFADLYGRYITDPDVFACPTAGRKGEEGVGMPELVDPGIVDAVSRGYIWELTDKVSSGVDGGEDLSNREFKLLQMATEVGDRVPLVRCSHHCPDHVHARFLNLTARGEVYESGVFWESEWVGIVPRPYLAPTWLAAAHPPIGQRLPARPVSAGPEMLDLRPWANARLQEPWIRGRPGEELHEFDGALEGGLFWHGGVAFDPAGVIQLNGKPPGPGEDTRDWNEPYYPPAVEGLRVGRGFDRLHVLGGVVFASDPGEVVAEIVFNYVDGDGAATGREAVSWKYGVDVANIGFREGEHDPEVTSPASSVAWTGYCEIGKQVGVAARIFHVVVDNPRPGERVESLDFVGGQSHAAPYIVALTADPPGKEVASATGTPGERAAADKPVDE